MPDERDFVAKLKSKLTKKQKSEKYGKGQYKAKWLEANARHLGGGLGKVEEELSKQKEMDKALGNEKRLQTEPFSGQAPKKKPKLEVLTIDEMRKKRVYTEVKAQGLKGYVALSTNFGDLNFELHASKAPKACENFLLLCKKGYYDDVTFHRLIPGFMVQGGDPTGTGRGGESTFGKPFEDEVDADLSHNAVGVLSMANAGANTNKSQFFVTFSACQHLDGKHTIFGKLVGGLKVLRAIEAVGCDAANQPLKPVVITGTKVHNDPFQDVAAKQKERRPTSVEDNPYLQHLSR